MGTLANCNPAIYAQFYPRLRTIAHEHGYALALHGSLDRDMDLIAVAWTHNPSNPRRVVKAMTKRLGLVFHKGWKFEKKPRGRIAVAIPTSDGWLDISFVGHKV